MVVTPRRSRQTAGTAVHPFERELGQVVTVRVSVERHVEIGAGVRAHRDQSRCGTSYLVRTGAPTTSHDESIPITGTGDPRRPHPLGDPMAEIDELRAGARSHVGDGSAGVVDRTGVIESTPWQRTRRRSDGGDRPRRSSGSTCPSTALAAVGATAVTSEYPWLGRATTITTRRRCTRSPSSASSTRPPSHPPARHGGRVDGDEVAVDVGRRLASLDAADRLPRSLPGRDRRAAVESSACCGTARRSPSSGRRCSTLGDRQRRRRGRVDAPGRTYGFCIVEGTPVTVEATRS